MPDHRNFDEAPQTVNKVRQDVNNPTHNRLANGEGRHEQLKVVLQNLNPGRHRFRNDPIVLRQGRTLPVPIRRIRQRLPQNIVVLRKSENRRNVTDLPNPKFIQGAQLGLRV